MRVHLQFYVRSTLFMASKSFTHAPARCCLGTLCPECIHFCCLVLSLLLPGMSKVGQVSRSGTGATLAHARAPTLPSAWRFLSPDRRKWKQLLRPFKHRSPPSSHLLSSPLTPLLSRGLNRAEHGGATAPTVQARLSAFRLRLSLS